MKRLILVLMLALVPTTVQAQRFRNRYQPQPMPQYQPQPMPQPEPQTQILESELQVQIAPENRVPNYTGIQCVWVSLSSLGKHNGIPQAANLWETFKTGTNPGIPEAELSRRGVKYSFNYNRDSEFLKKACEEGKGAAVGVPGHMLIVVHFKDGVVVTMDNTRTGNPIRSRTEQDFMNWWTGWAIVLEPEYKLMPKPQEQP